MAARQHREFHQVIEPLLSAEEIAILEPKDLDEAQRDYLRDYFQRNLLPLITPLAVDPGHPFPRLGNRILVLMAELESAEYRQKPALRPRPWPSSTCRAPPRRGSCGFRQPLGGTGS